MKLAFDPKDTYSTGYWRCPQCGNEFYSGEKTLHKEGCSVGDDDWDACVRVINPAVVSTIKEHSATHGDKSKHPHRNISLQDIRKQIPEALEN